MIGCLAVDRMLQYDSFSLSDQDVLSPTEVGKSISPTEVGKKQKYSCRSYRSEFFTFGLVAQWPPSNKVSTSTLLPSGQVPGRGYIPKVFAFENQYPLNPVESDLFYFLLICMKRPKSPKFQRAVSSSSELHAIQHIPRENTTLAFLLLILQNPRH